MISVIIPVYNAQDTIRRCLVSIISQQAADIEVIAIDDGSTDVSPAICDEYAEKDIRVHVFHKQNGGVSSARNAGLDAAHGEWITFVDSDDMVSDNWSECICKATDSCTVLDTFIASDVTIVRTDGFRGQVFKGIEFNSVSDIFKYNLSGAVWNKIFSKKVIDRYSVRFDEDLKFSEDCLFVAAYSSHMSRLLFIKEPIYIQYLPECYYSKYEKHLGFDSQFYLFKKIKAQNTTYARYFVDGLTMIFIKHLSANKSKDFQASVDEFRQVVGNDITHVHGKKKFAIKWLGNTSSKWIWRLVFRIYSSLGKYI